MERLQHVAAMLRKARFIARSRADSIVIEAVDGKYSVSGVAKRLLLAKYFNEPEGNVLFVVSARLSQFAALIIEKYNANFCEASADDRYELRYTISRNDLERHCPVDPPRQK
jgi:hypothetical protein